MAPALHASRSMRRSGQRPQAFLSKPGRQKQQKQKDDVSGILNVGILLAGVGAMTMFATMPLLEQLKQQTVRGLNAH